MAENPRIEELRRRVRADPASIAFAALAEEFRRIGRYDDAVETCRTGLQRHPAYLSARVTLGRALIETGDFDGAREELETVLRSAPENLAAIRGLAQIDERLGQSTEMDPHIADMMKTMHAESLRVAALIPPAPPPAPPAVEHVPVSSIPPEPLSLDRGADLPLAPQPDSDLSLADEPETELSLDPEALAGPELEFSLDVAAAGRAFSLDPEPAVADLSLPAESASPTSVDAATDLFAGYAPVSKREPAPDFTFDLANAFSIQPASDPRTETRFDLSIDSAEDPLLAAAPVPARKPAPAPPQSLREPDRTPERAPEPEPQLEPELEPEPEPEPESELYAASGPDPAMLATLARLERFLGAIQSLRQ